MAAGLFKAPTENYASTSLNGAINDSVTTITLNDASKLQAPGYVVIDREDGNGTATPNSREVIKYTGISTNDLTGVTRGADNSTARSHSDGALVEATFTIGMHNDQRDAINAEHTTSGTHVISTASIATIQANDALISQASIGTVTPGTLNAAVKGQLVWGRSGSLATVRSAVATDTHYPLNRATKNLTIDAHFFALTSAPSTAPAEFDISWASGPTGDFTSIFSVRPFIDIGEYTTVGSATAGTLDLTSLASGIVLRHEILMPGDAGGLTSQLAVTERP